MPNYAANIQKQNILHPGHVNTDKAIPGMEELMTKASDGKFVFKATDQVFVERFLILGTTTPTFYADSQKLTASALDRISEIVALAPMDVYDVMTAVMDTDRAKSKSPALFLCAYMSNHTDSVVRKNFLEYGVSIATTGSQFLEFVSYVDIFRRWGRMVKTTLSTWYTSKTTDQMLFQCTKYKNRFGWTHRDVLRKLKIKPVSAEQEAAFGFIVGKQHDVRLIPERFKVIETLNTCAPDAVSTMEIVEHAINGFDAPREWIPGPILARNYVWEYMYDKGMPETALLRNMGALAARNIFDNPKRKQALMERLGRGLKRVHPWQLFQARCVYGEGKGHKGTLTWPVDSSIKLALGNAMVKAFNGLKPNGKRKLIALDISGSMGNNRYDAQDKTLPEYEKAYYQAATLAYILAKSEPNAAVIGFCDRILPINMVDFTSLDQFIEALKPVVQLGGATHAAQVMRFMTDLPTAQYNQLFETGDPAAKIIRHREFDEVIFLTDNEANGREHTWQQLELYRSRINADLKFAAIAFAPNNFSLVHPNDTKSMDFCGFDANGFEIMYDFLNR